MKLPKNQVLALCFAIVIFANQSSLADGAASLPLHERPTQFRLSAPKIRYYPETGFVCAEGKCELLVPGAHLTASMLQIDLDQQTITARDIRLTGMENLVLVGSYFVIQLGSRSFAITEPELTIPLSSHLRLSVKGDSANCQDGTCFVERPVMTTCPHTPPGYQIQAESVTRHQSGDLDLENPSVIIENQRLFALHWLRLRPPDKTGFLFPRIAWDASGSLVLGPAGYIPIANRGYAEGHVAVRTNEGFETRSQLVMQSTSLTFYQLERNHEHSLRLEGHGYTANRKAAFSFHLDLPSDRQTIDAFAEHPMDRAVSHTSSRALARFDMGNLILEFNPLLLRLLEPETSIVHAIAIGLTYPTSPLVGDHLWLVFGLEFQRFGSTVPASYAVAVFPQNPSAIPGHLRSRLYYELISPWRVGPVFLETSVGGRHLFWIPDGTDEPSRNRHHLSVSLKIALPLGKRLQSFTHVITPYIRASAIPVLGGRNPLWITDRLDFLTTGLAMEAGLRSTWKKPGEETVFDLELYERLGFSGFARPEIAAYSVMRADIEYRKNQIRLVLGWDPRQSQPSTVAAFLTSHSNAGHFIRLGGRRIGPGHGPHQDVSLAQPLMSTVLPTWPYLPTNLVEVTEESSFRLSRRFSIFEGARLCLAPSPALTVLWYGFEISSSCNCLRLRITISHRYGSKIPDGMATFTLNEF